MSGPQVYLRSPSFTLSALWPENLPYTLPPPTKERSFRSPFGIDEHLFNFALRPEIPIFFAATYVAVVFALNAYNRNRNHKPWWISRQWWFKYFVVAHNALLTVYSAATFAAMCRAFAHTWPGLNNPAGLAGAADSLCKIHGPRGLGDAATYNTTINIWEVKNTGIKLMDGNPDPTDVGRFWNEGLAFWGWVFYVSKFYEVLDTLIILAKGKRSATLQTYHHAGAMLCMWAGIRYMSPPIWMFVFVNSFIHALMYTYFTLSAVGVRVPNAMKRTLTSLQIAQFVWGASYAAAHLFIQYDIPISTPYQVAATISSAASSATSAVQAATFTVSSVIATPSAVAWGALAKKLLLRALGEEGLAEKVTTDQGSPLSPAMEEKIEQFKEELPPTPRYETRWRTDWTKVDCIDTSGEAFAIYLNLFYLAPLTFLFARFFYKAYLRRGKPRTAAQGAKQVEDSSREAARKTHEKFEQTGARLEKELQKVHPKDIQEELRRDVQSLKEGTFKSRGSRRVSQHVQELERQVTSSVEKAKKQAKKVTSADNSPIKTSPKKNNLSAPKEDRWFGSENELAEAADGKDHAVKSSSHSAERSQHSSTSTTSQHSNSVKEETIQRGDDPKSTELLPSDGQSRAESESKQDENIEQTQATRTGVKDGLPTDWDSDREHKPIAQENTYASVASLGDTDAMGKSGAIVDFAAEKAEDAKQEAEELKKDSSNIPRPASASKRSGSPSKRSGSPSKPHFTVPMQPNSK